MEIRENALFGISQFSGSGSVDMLIDIAQNHPEHNIRKKAIFWLGQSDNDRAKQALLDVIEASSK